MQGASKFCIVVEPNTVDYGWMGSQLSIALKSGCVPVYFGSAQVPYQPLLQCSKSTVFNRPGRVSFNTGPARV